MSFATRTSAFLRHLKDAFPTWMRSLPAQSILGIILPIVLVTFGLLIAGLFAYQQVVTSLVIDRDRQLATLIAANMGEKIDGYANALKILSTSADLTSSTPGVPERALTDASTSLKVFTAGVAYIGPSGTPVATVSASRAATASSPIFSPSYIQVVAEQQRPSFGDILVDSQTGERVLVIGLLVTDATHRNSGALVGGVYLADAGLGATIQKLVIGSQGYVYVVDRQGRVLFHPDAGKVGADFSDHPFIDKVIAGASGGSGWSGPSGERVVEGYAPVPITGWGLVVVEPWETVVAPVQMYSAVLMVVGAAAITVLAFLLWRRLRAITDPLSRLAVQTRRLAAGETVEPVAEGGILEMDVLGQAFNELATQVASYRAGLRRYLGAITKSQEDERRHLARELHDETTQSLLAISRRLELYQASERDPTRNQQLAELQTMLTETLRNIRQISRDLRPLILEDLGLVPALETLAQAVVEGDETLRQVDLELAGEAQGLDAEQELALYRITQEALSNVRKHARATEAEILLNFQEPVVRLVVRDNGRGFVPGPLAELAQRGNFGLMGIQERVWAVGGSLTVQSAPGQGTRLTITMPKNAASETKNTEGDQPSG